MGNITANAHRWKILAACYLGIISFALVFQSLSPALDLMIQDIGLSHGQAGALMSYFALPGIVFSIPAGMLSDRYGARKVGLIALALMTAGSMLTALSRNFVMLALGRAIAGTGAFTLTITLTQLISIWFKDRELGFAMGTYNTGMPLGTIITLNILGLIGRTYNWHVSLYVTAAMSLLSLIVFYFIAESPAGAQSREKRISMSDITGIGRLGIGIWLVGISWLWVNAAGISFLTFGTDYFISQGKGSAVAGLLTSFLMIGSLFLSPAAGFMIDKGISQKAMIIAGSACLCIIYLLIPNMPYHAYLLTIILGVAAMLIPVSIFSLPARILPLRHVGTGFGIISTCLNIGIMVGPCMVGIARDIVGGYHTGFIMMAFFTFMSLVTISLLKLNNKK